MGRQEVGFCSEGNRNEGVEQICSLGCSGEAEVLNHDASWSGKVQGSTTVQTGSFS